MLDHVGFEVADLARSAAFYDALFHALGGRRIFDSPEGIGYGINDARLWIVARGRRPAPGFGHVALTASGRPAVDAAYGPHSRRGAPTTARPGPRHHTARATTPRTCSIPTASGSRSSAARIEPYTTVRGETPAGHGG